MTPRQGEVPATPEMVEPADPPQESAEPTVPRQHLRADLAAGGVVEVQSEAEQQWFNTARERYQAENKFTDITDLQDLDRLLQAELLLWRWNQWMSSGYDYLDHQIDDRSLSVKIKNTNETVTRLKDQMGLSRKARDSVGTSVTDKWNELKRRAKLFGHHRENQLRVALVLMNDLSWIVGTYDRSDEEERKKIGFPDEAQIVAWVRETMLPEFHEVDAYFIENEQKAWTKL